MMYRAHIGDNESAWDNIRPLASDSKPEKYTVMTVKMNLKTEVQVQILVVSFTNSSLDQIC